MAIARVRASDPAKIDTLRSSSCPASRMKTGQEHPVPLCKRALGILDAARTFGDGDSPIVSVTERGQSLDEKRMYRLLEKHEIAAVLHGLRS